MMSEFSSGGYTVFPQELLYIHSFQIIKVTDSNQLF